MSALNLPNLATNRIDEPKLHPYHLGASLYMPATRLDLWQVICRQKLPNLNSVIICLEDAVATSDIELACENLKQVLMTWRACDLQNFVAIQHRPLVFVRPRNPQMLSKMTLWQDIDLLDGFVLPKMDMTSLADWRLACQNLPNQHLLMPTLETGQIFSPAHNQEFAIALTKAFSQQIYALRIGGNDLMACLRLRRPIHKTLYDMPIGHLIYQLLYSFVPYGFYLTAPVFEYLDQMALFAEELAQDVMLGLVGKTVIHPSQILQVQQAFQVSKQEWQQAQAILCHHAKAVFKQDNAMLEPATHRAWAKQIQHRQQIFGIK